MSTTSDPDDPRLTHGADSEPVPMADVYLVLSAEERAKGFVRPVRRSYRHVGIPGPRHPLRDLTAAEQERYASSDYVKYEDYQGRYGGALGRFWTQAGLDAIGKGCGQVTTMSRALAETYSASPGFYGATYCCTCQMHLKVGAHGEFVWIEADGSDGTRVGT